MALGRVRTEFLAWALLAVLLVATPLGAQNGENPVPVDSPVYRWLGALETQHGVVAASRSAPYTARQVLDLVDQLGDDGPLAEAIRDALTVQPTYTEPGQASGSGLAVKITNEINPELYLGIGQETRKWDYGYNQRLPFVRFATEAWLFDGLYGAIDLQLQKDPFAVIDENQPISNAPSQVAEIDFEWPYWAGLVVGGPNWDARFFRSKASYAVSQWNLILSQDAGEVDQLSLSTWWNNFSYTFLWIPLDNTWISPGQTYGYFNTAENDSSNVVPYDQSKNFVVHRVQFRPLPQWSFALTEVLMMESSVFDPRYFNPLLPGHNWFVFENANSDVSLEVEPSPLPGWSIWGQFYGDYIKTAFKDELYHDPTPGAMAYLAGTRSVLAVADTLVTVEAEGVYTDPFLYLNNHANMLKTTRYLSNYGTPGRRMIDTPLGFELGPDTIAVRSVIRLEQPGTWRAEVGFPFQVRGENTIRTLHPLQQYAWTVPANAILNPLYGNPDIYLPWVTPTGTPEWKQGLMLAGEVGLPWKGTIGLQSTLSLIWNKDHVVAPMTWDWQSILTWTNSF